ncbi:MAG: REP element-mobilizing transposase RayT [Planctomycetota bacterium]
MLSFVLSHMGRKSRQDSPGSWHHVVNRGIAKRPLFETRADIRFFLSRLAREVRRGRIEIHAYSVLTTHFHLLVRSPLGEMSEALRQAQNAHSRRFNRIHQRDGALIRGRFFSKRVEDDGYWRTLIRYIDHNPVRAGMARSSEDYEFGSAHHYYRCDSGTLWLERDRVEREACRLANVSCFARGTYARAFGKKSAAETDELVDFVERRMRARGVADPLTDLVRSTPIEVQRWMERKTRLADGHTPGLPVCTAGALLRALEQDEESLGPWRVERGEALVPALPRAFVALAHDLAGLSWREISERRGESPMRCRLIAQEHRVSAQDCEEYRARTARVVYCALEIVLGQ